MSDALRLLLVLGLVLGNAVFVAAEYALVTARRSRLEERANAGSRAARVALRLMDDPVRFISTVQVGITIFAILTGAIGEPLLSRYFEEVMPDGAAFLVSFAILTYLSVVVGELVPKALALARADQLAVVLAAPLELLGRVFAPVVWVLQRSAAAIARLFGVDPAPAGVVSYTREDILHSVAAAEDFGAIEQAEEEMLYKVFDFASKEVHEVMVPRPEVVAHLGRPAARGGARGRDRLAVHALPGLPRVAGRHRRRPPRPRPLLRAPRPRHRAGADRGPATPRLRRPGDQGPRRPARRLPPRAPPHGDRGRRVRRHAGAS